MLKSSKSLLQEETKTPNIKIQGPKLEIEATETQQNENEEGRAPWLVSP